MTVKMRLYNKTNHVLTIKKGLSIAPKGSLVRDLEYSDHIKRLERNGFLAVTIYPETPAQSVSQNVEETVKKSRKSSKEALAEDENSSADNN